LYKAKGSCWSVIANEFPGLNENQVKNRFYSTLRRLATKKAMSNLTNKERPKTKKKDLIVFVDEAILYGHNCCSKRGRKRKLKPIVTDIVKDAQNENISQSNVQLENKEREVLSVHNKEELPNNDLVKNMEILQMKEEIELIKDKLIKEEPQIVSEKDDKVLIELNPNNNIKNQVSECGLMNSEYIQVLLTQNDEVLNEFTVLTRTTTMNTDLEELLGLEKKIKKCLQETQMSLGSQSSTVLE